MIFILVLLVIILVHEFGHFIVAKKSGIRVDEFGFGFPPKLFGKKFGETEYTFNLLPIGGFVKIFGETPNEGSLSEKDIQRSFIHKSKLTQAAVLSAGVFFNFLLAWVLIILTFSLGILSSVNNTLPEGAYIEDAQPMFVAVAKTSAAYEAGIRSGDLPIRLISEGDTLLKMTNADLQGFVADHTTDTITVEYKKRSGDVYSVNVVPQMSETLGRSILGVAVEDVGTLVLPSFGSAVVEGTKYTGAAIVGIAGGLHSFLMNVIAGSANFEEVAGPVGLFGIVGDAAAGGSVAIIMLTAVISINLGIINLLPFPALDGGRLLFLGIEAVRGKPIQPQIINVLNSLGFFFLIFLMIMITYHDVVKMF